MDCERGFTLKNALVVAIAVFLPIVAARADSHGDAWITTKAKAALEVTAGVRASAVTVDTKDGRVTLSGKVRSEKAKATAAARVGNVAGVVEVRNYLQVAAPGSKGRVWRSDDAVKADSRKIPSADRSLEAVPGPSVERNVGIPMKAVSPLQQNPLTTRMTRSGGTWRTPCAISTPERTPRSVSR